MFFRSLFFLLAVWLTGCASSPELERQDLPVPTVWPMGTQEGQEAAKTHWRQFFPDRQLQQLIAMALENNRDLRIAAARVQEARAQYGIARADRLPSVGLTGSGAFITTPSDLVSSGSPSTSERYDLGVSLLSYELGFWGRLSGLGVSARFSFLAS